ncbi:hypothetical protein [Streptomyces sp. NPDC091215]|uniref:hypothetical protein n=1 Tax=Streptomyces sp. NPDC091215 TaxID=3155192 RepID=UPI003444B4BD
MIVRISEETGAMWAVLLMLVALPAVGYGLGTRLTGKGRQGRAPWRPVDDPVTWVGAGAAVSGHALAAVAVVGSWGGISGPLATAYAGGCAAGALRYAYETFAREGEHSARVLRPALLLLVPYAFALGFFWLVAD